MSRLKHLWSIRHSSLYWTGTEIPMSLLQYAVTIFVIPDIVWESLNTRMDAKDEKIKELVPKLEALTKANSKLQEEVFDLKRRLALALTIDSPTAKR